MLSLLSALVVVAAVPAAAVPAPLTLSDATLNSRAVSNTTVPSTAAAGYCAGNSPSNRTAWCDYSIETDYYNNIPDTGVVREYWLELVNSTMAPDGIPRTVLTFNGTLPGPTIIADWGDTIVVHVINGVENNGTGIHFHGIRQNQTNPQDGVQAITQCPVAPGKSLTYTWRATEYGTTWYHSHFSLQAWEGAYGGLFINGPASANYDVDAGILSLSDWSHMTVDALTSCENTNCTPYFDTGLLNGTNTYGNGTNTTGTRFSMAVTEGQSYRLRLVSVAMESMFKFSIDDHNLTVIANDLVPIEPYTTQTLNINVGQRYDVIVTANQASKGSDFWMRAIPLANCSNNWNPSDIKGIFHYGNSTTDIETPTTTGYDYIDVCLDEDASNLVPVVPWTAGTDSYSETEILSGDYTGFDNLFTWYLNNTTFEMNWEDPTLLQVYDNSTDFTNQSHVYNLPEANVWAYLIINSENDTPHPIHLHGHDFLVLGQGYGWYNPSNVTLNKVNPPRRDTATMPENGYVVIAFKTDNPGTWICHCHIGWHAPQGFALQVVERQSEIAGLIDQAQLDTMQETCADWNSFMEEDDYTQSPWDSGL